MAKADSSVVRVRRNPGVEPEDRLVLLNLPAEIRPLFDNAPLLRHENPKIYRELMVRLAQDTRPSGVIEWLWLKDVTDLTWEIIRLHRIIAALIDAGRRAAVAEIAGPLGEHRKPHLFRDAYGVSVTNDPWEEASTLADEWFDPETRKETESDLASNGIDADAIAAVSFSIYAPQHEAAERMLATKEIRRNHAIGEIENSKQRFGQALRQASDMIVQAESLAIPPGKQAAK